MQQYASCLEAADGVSSNSSVYQRMRVLLTRQLTISQDNAGFNNDSNRTKGNIQTIWLGLVWITSCQVGVLTVRTDSMASVRRKSLYQLKIHYQTSWIARGTFGIDYRRYIFPLTQRDLPAAPPFSPLER